jgi:ammonia channel protein AmtB
MPTTLRLLLALLMAAALSACSSVPKAGFSGEGTVQSIREISEPSTLATLAGAISNLAKFGLFFGGGTKQLIAQLVGVLMVGAYVVPVSALFWLLIKATVGLRVSPQEEIEGLDIHEHGNEAYHGFVMVRSE